MKTRICEATRETPNTPKRGKNEDYTPITGKHCRHRHPVKKDKKCRKCGYNVTV